MSRYDDIVRASHAGDPAPADFVAERLLARLAMDFIAYIECPQYHFAYSDNHRAARSATPHIERDYEAGYECTLVLEIKGPSSPHDDRAIASKVRATPLYDRVRLSLFGEDVTIDVSSADAPDWGDVLERAWHEAKWLAYDSMHQIRMRTQ